MSGGNGVRSNGHWAIWKLAVALALAAAVVALGFLIWSGLSWVALVSIAAWGFLLLSSSVVRSIFSAMSQNVALSRTRFLAVLRRFAPLSVVFALPLVALAVLLPLLLHDAPLQIYLSDSVARGVYSEIEFLHFAANEDERALELRSRDGRDIAWFVEVTYPEDQANEGNWIEITPESGVAQDEDTHQLAVRVLRDCIELGEHEAAIRLYTDSGRNQVLRVAVEERPLPRIEASKMSVTYDGENLDPIEIRIHNDGADRLYCSGNIAVTSPTHPQYPWEFAVSYRVVSPVATSEYALTIDQQADSSEGVIRILLDVDPSRLPSFVDSCQLQVSIPVYSIVESQSVFEQTVTCDLDLVRAPAELIAQPDQLRFEVAGTEDVTKALVLSNRGVGLADIVTDWTNSSSWIKAVEPDGSWTLSQDESEVWRVTVDSRLLRPGSQTGSLVLLYGSGQVLEVNLSTHVPPPRLEIDRSEIAFSPDNPHAQLGLTNIGGHLLNWAIDYTYLEAGSWPYALAEIPELMWEEISDLRIDEEGHREANLWSCLIYPASGATWAADRSVIAVSVDSTVENGTSKIAALRVRNLGDPSDVAYVELRMNANSATSLDSEVRSARSDI